MQVSTSIVSPFDFGKQDIEAAFTMITEYLKNPAAVWDIAPLHCKLKLQWFNFPKGATFDGRKFRTAEICNLFKTNEGSSPSLSNVVHPVGIEPTTNRLRVECSTS